MRVILIARSHAHGPLARTSAPNLTLAVVIVATPALAWAQATSPFMTGATALQTNILAWLTPIAIILVMALGGMAMANRMRSEVAERLRAEYRRRVELRHGHALTSRAAAAPEAPRRDLEQVRHEA